MYRASFRKGREGGKGMGEHFIGGGGGGEGVIPLAIQLLKCVVQLSF